MFDYFGYFYEPFQTDVDYTFTREYLNKSLGMVFKPEGKFEGMTKKMNMPPFITAAFLWVLGRVSRHKLDP